MSIKAEPANTGFTRYLITKHQYTAEMNQHVHYVLFKLIENMLNAV